MSEKYLHMPDEKLISELRTGNTEIIDYLLNKYKYMVRKKARAMFLIGGDTDDLIQEGMIGLYKAIRDFNPEKDAAFSHFASICVSRQIYSAITASNRKKHSPLNTSISFSDSEQEEKLMDIYINPEQIFIDKEQVEVIEQRLEGCLSKYENEVLQLYVEGNDYTQIASMMEKEPKSIDNAIQRIKNKATVLLNSI